MGGDICQVDFGAALSSGFHDLFEDLSVDDFVSVLSHVVPGLPSSLQGQYREV